MATIPSGPTAPATVSPDNQGLAMKGRVVIGIAITALEKGIPLVGSTSPEGMVAVKALKELSSHFGKAPAEMGRQEAKLMGDLASPVPQPGPEQADAFQQQIAQRQQRVGMPGAAA